MTISVFFLGDSAVCDDPNLYLLQNKRFRKWRPCQGQFLPVSAGIEIFVSIILRTLSGLVSFCFGKVEELWFPFNIILINPNKIEWIRVDSVA